MTVTAETASLTLRERAAIAVKTREEIDLQASVVRAEQARSHEINYLVREMKRWLALEVEPSDVRYHRSGELPNAIPPATVTIDGLTFGMAPVFDGDGGTLCVRVECTKGCAMALWVNAEGWETLGRALEQQHEHPYRYECLVIYDEEGEPITDRDGNPLTRSSKPVAPPPTLADRLAELLREVVRDELANQGVGV